MGTELADDGCDVGPADPGAVHRDDVVANAGGDAPDRLGVDDHPVDRGGTGQGDGEAGRGVSGCRRPAAPGHRAGDRPRGRARRGRHRTVAHRQVGPVGLGRAEGQCVADRIRDEGHLIGDGKAVGGARGYRDCRGAPIFGGEGDRDGATAGCCHRHRPVDVEAVRPDGRQLGGLAAARAELCLVGLGNARLRHRDIRAAGDLVGRDHGGQRCRLHVVVGVAGLDEREGDPVVAPTPLVEVVAPHRDVQRLLPDHGPRDGVGLSEEVVLAVRPPPDLGEPQWGGPQDGFQLLDLCRGAVLFERVVVVGIGVDGGNVQIAQAAGCDQLLPPADGRLQGRSADDRRGPARLHRLDRGVEGGEHLGDVLSGIAPSGVVGFVPGLPHGDRGADPATGRRGGVERDQPGDIGLPEATRHQCRRHGIAPADLDPVGDVIGAGLRGCLEGVVRSMGKGHGRRSTGGEGRIRRRAVGQHGSPIDGLDAPRSGEAQLGVEGDAPRIARATRADPGRQSVQVEAVTAGSDRVGETGRAQSGGR